MPLHPQAEQMLAAAGRLNLPPLNELDPVAARAAYNKRADAVAHFVDMDSVDDRTFPGPGGEVPIRIYRPTGAPVHPPTMMFFHGGGWVYSTVPTYDAMCRVLADMLAAVVVSVEYRLAPEHPYPSAADDCLAAVRWVVANADALEIDGSRVAVCGDSAGGNLAAVVAQDCRDLGLDLRAQVLVYPATELADFETASFARNGEGLALTTDAMHWFIGHYVTDVSRRVEPRCSPSRGELAGLTPALVITAEYDPLLDDGLSYAALLTDAGVDTKSITYEGMVHTFFNQPGIVDASLDCARRIAAFLEQRW